MASGGGSSGGGVGGGESKLTVSISRTVRAGTSAVTTKIRAKPSNASINAEAVRPMMVDLKFKSRMARVGEKLQMNDSKI